jgi:hypothetical protein
MSDYQRPQIVAQSEYHPVQAHMHPHVPSQTYEPLASYSSPQYMVPTTAHEGHFNGLPATTLSTHALAAYPGYTSHPVSAQPRQESVDGNYNPPLHRANSLDSSWNRTQVDVHTMRQGSLDSTTWKSETGASPSAEALAEALGGLKIDHMAIGMIYHPDYGEANVCDSSVYRGSQ